MNSRFLAALAALLVIVLAAAVWLSTSRDGKAAKTSTLLYPALKGQLDSVKAVRIYGAGNHRKAELVRVDNEWRVTERAQYPAASDKVRQLVIDLSAAKRIEEKTSKPSHYAALGLEDIAGNTTGARVELVGPSGVDLIVGNTGPGANSRYVRKSGEKTSWLVDRMLGAPSEPKEWLNTRLIDIPANRIHSVQVQIEGQQPYGAAKANRTDAHFSVDGLKKGQTLNTESAADPIASALANLNLEDVAPYAEWQNKAPQAHATYTTFDGVIVELSGWIDGNVHHVHARARYDEPLAQQFAPKDKNSPPAPDRIAEAVALDARLQPWVFQIPDYKYSTLFTPLEGLLKK